MSSGTFNRRTMIIVAGISIADFIKPDIAKHRYAIHKYIEEPKPLQSDKQPYYRRYEKPKRFQ